ncbi:MAG: hypothetical protein AVDCRST_MAG64-3866, partial [uncultured Phycisphaerae bacterium]
GGKPDQPGVPDRPRPRRQLQGGADVREGHAADGQARGEGHHPRPHPHHQGGQDGRRRRRRRHRRRGRGAREPVGQRPDRAEELRPVRGRFAGQQARGGRGGDLQRARQRRAGRGQGRPEGRPAGVRRQEGRPGRPRRRRRRPEPAEPAGEREV